LRPKLFFQPAHAVGEEVAHNDISIAEVLLPHVAVAELGFAAPKGADELGPGPNHGGVFIANGCGSIFAGGFVNQAAVAASKIINFHPWL